MSQVRDVILVWRRQGLSDAEIGRRLGVSSSLLRLIADDPPHDDRPEADDNAPNHAGVR